MQSPVFAVDRVQGNDSALNCEAIAKQQLELKALMDAGNTERTLGTAAVGGAADVGGQVATAQVASGLFGAFGGIASKVAGAVARGQAEKAVGPSPEAQALAVKAAARHDFLTQLASAKNCGGSGAEKTLSLAEYQQVAMAPPLGQVQAKALTSDVVVAALQEPVDVLDISSAMDGSLAVRNRTIVITEYRVLFDVGGEVNASTRGGYLLGTDYGSTRVTVKYKIPNVDVAAFQAITDRAFEDFKARMLASGANVRFGNPAEGGVYDTTEPGSSPDKPVYLTKKLGQSTRQYLVMAPTGMRLIPRGFTGIGAGNIGKRIEWSKANTEGLSITQTIQIAEHESSGSGSSIFRRGSEADAKSSLSAGAPDELVVQSHVYGGVVRIKEPLPVPGAFANFKAVGGFDSDKDTGMQVLGRLQNLAGMGADKFKTVEQEVELNGPAMARLSLQGLATLNKAVVDAIR